MKYLTLLKGYMEIFQIKLQGKLIFCYVETNLEVNTKKQKNLEF